MIPKEFKKTRALAKEYSDFAEATFGYNITPEQEAWLEYSTNSKGENWNDAIQKSFTVEYEQLTRKNAYFQGCSLEQYLHHFERRKNEYLVENSQADFFHFLESELKSNLEFVNPNYNFHTTSLLIKHSLERQNEFIEEKLFELGYKVDYSNFDDRKLPSIQKIHTKLIEGDDEEIIKATEKIIMLHELGVLDYLRTKEPFRSSINILAQILSTILDEKSSTLQSYLNPMYSPNVLQKNSPIKNQNTVEKVKTKLSEIGFKK